MGKRLRMDNGEVVDAATRDDLPPGVYVSPVVLLDCAYCDGWTRHSQVSATVVECLECGQEQSNERLEDLTEL